MKINLGKTELIHFVGIGGIGMSGLALIMNGLGFKVQGSDISLNKNIDRLNEKKIKIFLNHNKNNIKNSTILVISSAIKKNNPELKLAKKLNLPIYTRGEMLGHIVSLMRNIVVTGSHGKTTTTSLISSIFSEAKLDPTIINGGVLNSFGNSARLGKSNWCIIESDESDGSFLKIPFTYSIITNIDAEHLDFYKSISVYKNYELDFFEILRWGGIQRNLRILGVLSRLFIEKNLDFRLKDIPMIFNNLIAIMPKDSPGYSFLTNTVKKKLNERIHNQ